MSSGYHTSWTVPPEHCEDPAYRAAGRRMDFAQAVYDRRSALGWSTAELARRARMAESDIESVKESAVDPTLELIELLAAALDTGPVSTPARPRNSGLRGTPPEQSGGAGSGARLCPVTPVSTPRPVPRIPDSDVTLRRLLLPFPRPAGPAYSESASARKPL
ncbi:multiprotein-bridging factor 1 family protein [Streptomyces sp. NPDC058657]|uniref:helix-turn-helix domain-containing protein n=1 Tax=unclassified Streptomyces TaxID=2593676 RepID=UPI00365652CF